jgi:predicted branched-subunit amino acid permease
MMEVVNDFDNFNRQSKFLLMIMICMLFMRFFRIRTNYACLRRLVCCMMICFVLFIQKLEKLILKLYKSLNNQTLDVVTTCGNYQQEINIE